MQAATPRNHEIRRQQMSIPIANRGFAARVRRRATAADHEQNSWQALIGGWLARIDRINQRDDLRAIANDPHLLADLGLTRERVLEEADKPFWR
ncbi:hypothetical protein GPL17_07930 [Bradyrhizobium yuanmingense]|uniref:hypothetical protein n=1 Tax=Bradyrhizobium yuanmingense TaxID=108015 RepID=UPI0012FB9FDC|nr:hypothetical protein [Bradyrhizobium yuanmingense]MVT50421.1 hypothetical protein [Bradyrhizobium yuanmingense]